MSVGAALFTVGKLLRIAASYVVSLPKDRFNEFDKLEDGLLKSVQYLNGSSRINCLHARQRSLLSVGLKRKRTRSLLLVDTSHRGCGVFEIGVTC